MIIELNNSVFEVIMSYTWLNKSVIFILNLNVQNSIYKSGEKNLE